MGFSSVNGQAIRSSFLVEEKIPATAVENPMCFFRELSGGYNRRNSSWCRGTALRCLVEPAHSANAFRWTDRRAQ